MKSLIALSFVVMAHSWYPEDCCNGNAMNGDCHPVSCGEIEDRKDGSVQYRGSNFSGPMIRPSEDGDCHACIGYYQRTPIPHCIFLKGKPTS